MNLAERVAALIAAYPPQMVADMALEVATAHELPEDDLAWIVAHWELTKPRVHKRTLSDGITVREAAG